MEKNDAFGGHDMELYVVIKILRELIALNGQKQISWNIIHNTIKTIPVNINISSTMTIDHRLQMLDKNHVYISTSAQAMCQHYSS